MPNENPPGARFLWVWPEKLRLSEGVASLGKAQPHRAHHVPKVDEGGTVQGEHFGRDRRDGPGEVLGLNRPPEAFACGALVDWAGFLGDRNYREALGIGYVIGARLVSGSAGGLQAGGRRFGPWGGRVWIFD